jgi:hypothetical protein
MFTTSGYGLTEAQMHTLASLRALYMAQHAALAECNAFNKAHSDAEGADDEDVAAYGRSFLKIDTAEMQLWLAVCSGIDAAIDGDKPRTRQAFAIATGMLDVMEYTILVARESAAKITATGCVVDSITDAGMVLVLDNRDTFEHMFMKRQADRLVAIREKTDFLLNHFAALDAVHT